MPIEFEYPKMKYGVNPPAVYKMTFDTGHFYYGSSRRVKTRFVSWRTVLKTGQQNNKLMGSILPSVKKVKFEIIRLTPDKETGIDEETKLIKSNWGNPMLMNRCPDGKDHTGFKAVNTDGNTSQYAIFNSNDELIEICPTLTFLREKYEVTAGLVYSFINGYRTDVNGYRFKRVKKDGKFIEPMPFKKRDKKTTYANSFTLKPITLYHEDGTKFKTFKNLLSATTELGVDFAEAKTKVITSKYKFFLGYYWERHGHKVTFSFKRKNTLTESQVQHIRDNITQYNWVKVKKDFNVGDFEIRKHFPNKFPKWITRQKQIIDTETNEIIESVQELSGKLGWNMKRVYKNMSGNPNFRYKYLSKN